MEIHSQALSAVLGACAFSSSTDAFLHSPPRSSTLSISNRTNRLTPQRRSNLSEAAPPGAPSLISQLAFYPSDESLTERLKNVQAELDNVKKEGIGKFFADELEAAENIIRGNVERAESGANNVILKGESDDYLLKDGFQAMGDTGKRLTSELKEIRQEFDELKAAKIVEKAAEDIVETTVLVEKDLEKVVENVVASLEEAEEAVQSAIVAVLSNESFTDRVKVDLTNQLESKAKNIEESVRVADSVAKTAKQIAVEDEKVISELEQTGDRLSAAIDATETLTETLKGTEGGAAVDAVSITVDQTAAIVKEDLAAAESIADAVSQKVVMAADAVIALDEKAAGSVMAVRAAKTSILESDGNDDSGGLTSALTKDAADIKIDEDAAEKLANAIQKDTINDQEALEVLGRSSLEVNTLIDAVDDAVDKVEDVTTSKASADSITEIVDKIQEEVREVEESIFDVEEVTEDCEDCNMKKITVELKGEAEAKESTQSGYTEKVESDDEESNYAIEKDRVDFESKSEVAHDRGEFNIDTEGGLAANAKQEVEGEVKQDQNVDLLTKSSSEVKGENNVLLAQNQSGAGVDSTESMGHEAALEPLGATTVASDHDGASSLGDAVASVADEAQHFSETMIADSAKVAPKMVLGGDLADAVASANPPQVGNVLVSHESATSGVAESITSSDATHHVATLATEALVEAVTVVSSLIL